MLFLQEDIAPKVLEMLTGAMDELAIGDPAQLATDVGPVIDELAREGLLKHVEAMKRVGKLLHQCRLDERHAHGSFVPSTLVEIDRMDRLESEPFGPVLHVVRWRADRLDQAVRAARVTHDHAMPGRDGLPGDRLADVPAADEPDDCHLRLAPASNVPEQQATHDGVTDQC